MTTIFSLATALSRTAALGALEKRAHENGLLISVCRKCKCYMGEKPGEGVTELSHSLCPSCFEAAFVGDVQ